MTIINKILAWIKLNVASVLGLLQIVVKFVKEVLTLALNILFPAFPHNESFEATVMKVRDFCNVIDGWIEKIKAYLIVLPTGA